MMNIHPLMPGIARRPVLQGSNRFGRSNTNNGTAHHQPASGSISLKLPGFIQKLAVPLALMLPVGLATTAAHPAVAQTHQTSPVEQPAEPAQAITIKGTVKRGVEAGVIVMKDKTTNKTYQLAGIEPKALTGWLRDGVKANVTIFDTGRTGGDGHVISISPANILLDNSVPVDPSPPVNIPVQKRHLSGTITYNAKQKSWSIRDDKTGETRLLKGINDEKLAAWFKPGVVAQVTGKPSDRPNFGMQGILFEVSSAVPVLASGQNK